MSQQLRRSSLLLLTALIWGIAFVAQSVGMEHVGPYTFNCVRSLLGGAVLLPVILLRRRSHVTRRPETPAERGRILAGGVVCGLFLAVASALQQFGIQTTDSVGKAGFITALYIILVPIIGLFLGRRCSLLVWIGAGLSVVGLYLLCMSGRMTLTLGDGLLLACALAFAGHILVIDHFVQATDGVTLACIQFFTCAAVSALAMLAFERPTWEALAAARMPILYAGLLSSGVGYTLQMVGQRHMDPTVASLILSLESVFSVLAGWLLLHQALSGREILGCVLMFAAIVLAQLPGKMKNEQ